MNNPTVDGVSAVYGVSARKTKLFNPTQTVKQYMADPAYKNDINKRLVDAGVGGKKRSHRKRGGKKRSHRKRSHRKRS